MELTTRRLSLLAVDGQTVRQVLEGRLHGQPAGWPEAEARWAWEPWLEREPAGWGPWLLYERDGAGPIGDAGFKGPPDALGRVELAYFVVPAHRRRGVAAEAVMALVAWALTQPEVTAVTAECHPDNHGSIGVLRRCGFQLLDADDSALWWSRER